VIFVFGSPDESIIDAITEAYNTGLGRYIVVTGGINPNPKISLIGWTHKNIPESRVQVNIK
jgi:hypothetical protein